MGSYDLPFHRMPTPLMPRGTLPDQDRHMQALNREADLISVDRIQQRALAAYARRDFPQVLTTDTNPRRGPTYDRAWGPQAPVIRAPLLKVVAAEPINARGLDREMQARADAYMDTTALSAQLGGSGYRVNPLDEPPTHLRPPKEVSAKVFMNRVPGTFNEQLRLDVPVVPGETHVYVLGQHDDSTERAVTASFMAGGAHDGLAAGDDAEFLRNPVGYMSHEVPMLPAPAVPLNPLLPNAFMQRIMAQRFDSSMLRPTEYRDPSGQ
jgi:hypothetical protein